MSSDFDRKTAPEPSLNYLLWVTAANYLAQIPYYLHNYYFPYHSPPSALGVILLGAMLIWFLMGYVGLRRGSSKGYVLLVSFLCFEALFYLHTLLTGALFFQLHNPSLLIKSVFIIGYVSGMTAGYYAYRLIRYKAAYRK